MKLDYRLADLKLCRCIFKRKPMIFTMSKNIQLILTIRKEHQDTSHCKKLYFAGGVNDFG